MKKKTIIENIFLHLSSFIGRMAEWLGRALQKLVQRFESASDLFFTLVYRCFLPFGYLLKYSWLLVGGISVL